MKQSGSEWLRIRFSGGMLHAKKWKNGDKESAAWMPDPLKVIAHAAPIGPSDLAVLTKPRD